MPKIKPKQVYHDQRQCLKCDTVYMYRLYEDFTDANRLCPTCQSSQPSVTLKIYKPYGAQP